MDASPPIEHLSPNHDARPPGRAIDMLVLHYTGMRDATSALARLCAPTAKVSAHYLIDEDGTLYTLVPEHFRAWHAGVSSWAGETGVNGRSLGIELVNPGHEFGYRPFPEPQMMALERLARDILVRHPIPAQRVLGHSDIAPARKADPGELFDWRRLAAGGVGLWPGPALANDVPALALGASGDAVHAAQERLAAFGYGIDADGNFGLRSCEVVMAFQRHFRPALVDGRFDGETGGILDALHALIG